MSQATNRPITEGQPAAIWPLRPQIDSYPVSLMDSLGLYESFDDLRKTDTAPDDIRCSMYDAARETEVAHIIRAPAGDVHEINEKAKILLARMIENDQHRHINPMDAADFALFASICQDLERLSDSALRDLTLTLSAAA